MKKTIKGAFAVLLFAVIALCLTGCPKEPDTTIPVPEIRENNSGWPDTIYATVNKSESEYLTLTIEYWPIKNGSTSVKYQLGLQYHPKKAISEDWFDSASINGIGMTPEWGWQDSLGILTVRNDETSYKDINIEPYFAEDGAITVMLRSSAHPERNIAFTYPEDFTAKIRTWLSAR